MRRNCSLLRASVLIMTAALLLNLPGIAQAAPPRQDTQRIEFDQSIEGRITENATEQEWTFTGHAGDVILIDMRASGSSTLDTLLTLLDPAKNTIMTDDDGGEGLNSRIGPYPLDQDGIYTIIAASYNGTGSFTLALKNLNTIPVLVSGKTLVGTVNAEHTADYFQLALPTNATIPLIRLEVFDDNPYAEPYLAVYGSGGFIVGTDQGDPPVLDPIALTGDGMIVAVVSWDPDSSGGRYQIQMRSSEVALMQNGVSQQGELDYSTTSQEHYFIAASGDVIRMSISTPDDIAPAIDIHAVDYSAIPFQSQGDTVRELTAQFTVAISGVYVISVSDGSLMGETGTYTIQLDWIAE